MKHRATISKKKRAFTTDDLHMQEVPALKRMKTMRNRALDIRKELDGSDYASDSEDNDYQELSVMRSHLEDDEESEGSGSEGGGDENEDRSHTRSEDEEVDDKEEGNDSDSQRSENERPSHFSFPSTEVNDRFPFSARTNPDARAPTPASKTSSVEVIPPTEKPSYLSMGISAPLRAALKSMSIVTPTEVQAACIPAMLAGASLYAGFEQGYLPSRRKGLYRQCKDRLREDDCVCSSHPSKVAR